VCSKIEDIRRTANLILSSKRPLNMTRSHRCRNLPFALAAAFLLAVLPGHARAQGGCVQGAGGGCSTAPEIDPGLANGGLVLLGGAVLVLRDRRKDADR
jgi:hypothetical protein